MIYTLSVECVSGRIFVEKCVRVIEIEENDSLYSLHNIIQTAVNFDRDHLFDFYAGRDRYHRKITFENYGFDEYVDYDAVILNQVYPLQNMKLYYFFDYGDSWIFEIRKKRGVKEPEPGVEYPRIIERIGPNPPQYSSYEE